MRRILGLLLPVAALVCLLFLAGCVKDPVVKVTPFVAKSSDTGQDGSDELH